MSTAPARRPSDRPRRLPLPQQSRRPDAAPASSTRSSGEAAELASQRLVARGLPELPNTTPHTLRRTYISIALLANNFDVLWVMRQVGHADSKMTMDVYAQLQQRAERQHGEAFDALVRRARERLYGATEERDAGDDPGQRTVEDLVDEWRDGASS